MDMSGATVLAATMAAIIFAFEYARHKKRSREDKRTSPLVQQPTITKAYTGSQARAGELFKADSVEMAARGYFPISQTWAQGEWRRGTFLVALLLCLVLIGIFIFAYMLIVKPDGTLTVTYALRGQEETVADMP